MRYYLIILILLVFVFCKQSALASLDETLVCPLCSFEGNVLCPEGFEATCQDENPDETEPKCVFFENKYVPGCWKFIGIKKMDFNLGALNMPPSVMIDIVGGGETYTLNREIIGCKKL
ncbi:MAG: hypothetical protein A3B68_02240 [Candidatus Melainabacteria bacterium RIFCSPHIGHO2_02_FULL_34_12]|nr:MAG: hypothetical protein A3B68_02240 [Candidatus Melainabacteria bacterium RIFCSPHIGHO2_02_FULL_34_12]